MMMLFNCSPIIECSERLMEQNENVTCLLNSLCLLCPQSLLVPLQTTKIICLDFFWNSVFKWCRFVKTVQKCQNGGGFKMSKLCRHVNGVSGWHREISRVVSRLYHVWISFYSRLNHIWITLESLLNQTRITRIFPLKPVWKYTKTSIK